MYHPYQAITPLALLDGRAALPQIAR